MKPDTSPEHVRALSPRSSGPSGGELSSAINRSEFVSEYRKIMPDSSQACIRDVDHPELKPTQCSSLLECDVVRFEARPSANSDLVCPVRGWNEVVHDCNGWSRILTCVGRGFRCVES